MEQKEVTTVQEPLTTPDLALIMLDNAESWVRHMDEAKYRLWPEMDISDEQALKAINFLQKYVHRYFTWKKLITQTAQIMFRGEVE